MANRNSKGQFVKNAKKATSKANNKPMTEEEARKRLHDWVTSLEKEIDKINNAREEEEEEEDECHDCDGCNECERDEDLRVKVTFRNSVVALGPEDADRWLETCMSIGENTTNISNAEIMSMADEFITGMLKRRDGDVKYRQV
jgi:hypothetical protein